MFLERRYSYRTRSIMKPSDHMFYSQESEEKILYACKEKPDSIFMNGNSCEKKICFTFDDAPDDTYTEQILKVLDYYKIPCGFAILGRNIQGKKDILQNIFEKGHTIMNHSFLHLDLKKCDTITLRKEILETEYLIDQALHIRTRILRPPYGSINCKSIKAIADLDYDILLWSYNTFDWLARDKDEIIAGMAEQIRSGEIILLHSSRNKKPTLEALPYMIERLLQLGFDFQRPEVLLKIKAYR